MSISFELQNLIPEFFSPRALARLDGTFQKTLEKLTSFLDPSKLEEQLGAVMANASSIELEPVLLEGLAKIVKVQTARSQGATLNIPLHDKTLSIQHDPKIEISIDGVATERIILNARIALTLESGLVEVEGGRIVGLRLWAASAKIFLGVEGRDLYDRDLGKIALPPKIDFGAGRPPTPVPSSLLASA